MLLLVSLPHVTKDTNQAAENVKKEELSYCDTFRGPMQRGHGIRYHEISRMIRAPSGSAMHGLIV
jgi:hypothetical protein